MARLEIEVLDGLAGSPSAKVKRLKCWTGFALGRGKETLVDQ